MNDYYGNEEEERVSFSAEELAVMAADPVRFGYQRACGHATSRDAYGSVIDSDCGACEARMSAQDDEPPWPDEPWPDEPRCEKCERSVAGNDGEGGAVPCMCGKPLCVDCCKARAAWAVSR